ncbi:MAG TPA: hypothetical protein VK789_15095 [Bryobacteraceae bacterium]|nr:hypothetical protein [Bryobacteraceae bacterium]
MSRARLISGFCGLVAVLVVSGCGAAEKLNPTGVLKRPLRLDVHIDNNANSDSPVAVDLVSVNDKDLAKDLAKMTASDWFQKRDQIREDNPKAADITVMKSWEWVPGQVIGTLQIPMKKKPRALLIFANYGTPGPHRAKIDPSITQEVALNRDDLKVQPLAK